MKTTAFKIISVLLAAAFFYSCEETDVLQPHAAMSIEGDKHVFDINETMEIHFTGRAENVVIYTGDNEHDYELREQSNYGLVVNKGLFTYSYRQPGTYKVVCVATNHGDAGCIIKRDTCSLMVKVIDDATTINRLSAPQVYYDEVFAEAVNETDWFLRLPRKIILNKSEIIVPLKQKLKFYIDSDSTSVQIDGQPFSSKTTYNLENVLDIAVKSHEGTERDYKLYTVNYGEFETFSLLGETAKLTRSEFDYSYYEINMTVPAGSDLTNIAPDFTLYANNKLYVDNEETGEAVEQVSGVTAHDFSRPVTYRFEASHPERPDIVAESTCVVTVTVAAE